MARTRCKFKQDDITRACKGAQNAGLSVRGVEIDPNGRILIRCDEIPNEEAAVNSIDAKIEKEIHAA